MPMLILSANIAMGVIPCSEAINTPDSAKKCVTEHVIGHENDVTTFLNEKNMPAPDILIQECTTSRYTPENNNISVFKESTFAGKIDGATLQGKWQERQSGPKGHYFQCYIEGPEGCYFNRDGRNGVLTTRASILISKDTGHVYSISPVKQPMPKIRRPKASHGKRTEKFEQKHVNFPTLCHPREGGEPNFL
jgi:hypothetical protein